MGSLLFAIIYDLDMDVGTMISKSVDYIKVGDVADGVEDNHGQLDDINQLGRAMKALMMGEHI